MAVWPYPQARSSEAGQYRRPIDKRCIGLSRPQRDSVGHATFESATLFAASLSKQLFGETVSITPDPAYRAHMLGSLNEYDLEIPPEVFLFPFPHRHKTPSRFHGGRRGSVETR